MHLKEIQRIAKEWFANRGRYCEAWEALDEACLEQPLVALRIIEEIHHHASATTPADYELMGNLAAGPLEDLLARNGAQVIDQIEQLARTDPEFRRCLTGIWRNTIPHEIFARVQHAADPSFQLSDP